MNTNSSNSQSWPWVEPPPTNQRQPLPPPPFVDPFVMQQLLESQANSMPEGSTSIQHFYGSPICVGPEYQGMAQQHQDQYRAPSSGPSHNRHCKGFRRAEAQCTNHNIHESSGTITEDHSTGVHPGHARIITSDNTGAGGAWRPPPRNPLMVGRSSTQQRKTPYSRDRSLRTRRNRTDKVDVSVYEIPIVESERGAIAGGSNIPAPLAYAQTNTNTKAELEEDDFDTISLGSDTDYQY